MLSWEYIYVGYIALIDKHDVLIYKGYGYGTHKYFNTYDEAIEFIDKKSNGLCAN